ncbi:MAG TPA: PhoH family protein [Pirellulaceae bacterium]
MTEATIALVDQGSVLTLFGARDQHIRRISDTFDVSITHRDGHIRVAGQPEGVRQATEVLEKLKSVVERRGSVVEDDVAEALATLAGHTNGTAAKSIEVLAAGKQVRPRTAGQAVYTEAIRKCPLVFAEGPAGTGKTYLAVAMAVESFKRNEVKKIVLVRPAVEAGESLGFLPGDMFAKINPYLRPLLDALYEMMNYEQVKLAMERDTIEVLPLAYMRGRTLNEAFIILDEAQNTTVSQMKMFLTRMGQGSRIVVAGDITQVDLPAHTQNGMSDAIQRLRHIEGVAHIRLTRSDIVRHRLVHEIVQAYEEGRKKRR